MLAVAWASSRGAGPLLFLWLGRVFSLRPWMATVGFFSCYLMGQMPYQTGLIQSANIYLWASAALVCALVIFSANNRRLLPLFFLFTALAATGARPDVF